MYVLVYSDGTYAGPVFACEPDLQLARTYTNTGAAKNSARHYKAPVNGKVETPVPLEVHIALGPHPEDIDTEEPVEPKEDLAPPITFGKQ